jgi:hypothetical protein
MPYTISGPSPAPWPSGLVVNMVLGSGLVFGVQVRVCRKELLSVTEHAGWTTAERRHWPRLGHGGTTRVGAHLRSQQRVAEVGLLQADFLQQVPGGPNFVRGDFRSWAHPAPGIPTLGRPASVDGDSETQGRGSRATVQPVRRGSGRRWRCRSVRGFFRRQGRMH